MDAWLEKYITQEVKDQGGDHTLFKLGYYETLTRENGVNSKDLIVLFWLIYYFVLMQPKAKAKKKQVQDSLTRILGKFQGKKRKLNHSMFPDKVFAKFFAKKWMIIMFHVRKLKRDPD